MNNVLNTLGLATRAKKVVTGETLIMSIRKSEVKFVIIATDASDNTVKKITDKCKSYHVDYFMYGTIDELSKAIGKSNRVAVGLLDDGFAKSIRKKIGG